MKDWWIPTCIMSDQLLQRVKLRSCGDVVPPVIKLADLVVFHIVSFGCVEVSYGERISTWRGTWKMLFIHVCDWNVRRKLFSELQSGMRHWFPERLLASEESFWRCQKRKFLPSFLGGYVLSISPPVRHNRLKAEISQNRSAELMVSWLFGDQCSPVSEHFMEIILEYNELAWILKELH